MRSPRTAGVSETKLWSILVCSLFGAELRLRLIIFIKLGNALTVVPSHRGGACLLASACPRSIFPVKACCSACQLGSRRLSFSPAWNNLVKNASTYTFVHVGDKCFVFKDEIFEHVDKLQYLGKTFNVECLVGSTRFELVFCPVKSRVQSNFAKNPKKK